MAMIEVVMRAINNFFEREYADGIFTVENGEINESWLRAGDYIAIVGSNGADGVHVNGEIPVSERFSGRVYKLHPPSSFLAKVGEIEAFNRDVPPTAPTSESFGQYSYSRATGGNGVVAGWESVFYADLAPYRRMFTEVDL